MPALLETPGSGCQTVPRLWQRSPKAQTHAGVLA